MLTYNTNSNTGPVCGGRSMAHSIVQDINTQTASWIHAYLHRVEGDLGNANYWYNRAGEKSSTESLEVELNKIIKSVL